VASIQPGSPQPLGATWTRSGVNFAIFSQHATRIEISIVDAARGVERARYELPARSGDIWHGLLPPSLARVGALYAYYVHGPNDAVQGQRFDAALPLLDPCARAMVQALSPTLPPLARVIDTSFEWGGDRPPAIPWRDTLIYELHVKGFTQLHPEVPEHTRGKYLGLTMPAVIEHLQSIGVTAVELLPVQAFLSERFLLERSLKNYWGYNPVAWFAPANEYAVDDAVVEFKTMVKALHASRLEVILDVVFNHTAEGSEAGPTLSLRGIDNTVYYRLLPQDKRHYENLTGCGNTVNCEHPEVRALIVDCLKYWVEEMHVDGFRFDLATVLARDGNGFNKASAFFEAVRAEPALAYIKLIAEPWDVGLGGYQLGNFPQGWAEWNDRYRDTARAFWRRDDGRIGEFAERISGSSDVFRHYGRKPTASINFLTAHDGFTLNDLVSYKDRHNEANLDGAGDGHDNNLSWNCGVEGPSDDEAVRELRRRQMRSLLATLFLSQGVPMLQAGDEIGRTQRGNNNAYCQDNEISWIDWRLRDENADLLQFVRLLARLRQGHVELRRETFFKGSASRAVTQDVTWLHARGTEMTKEDWQQGGLRALGMWFGKRHSAAPRLLLLFNSGDALQEFILPSAAAKPWSCVLDTARDTTASADLAHHFPLAPSSVALLEC
jgi:glycogen operon protein